MNSFKRLRIASKLFHWPWFFVLIQLILTTILQTIPKWIQTRTLKLQG